MRPWVWMFGSLALFLAGAVAGWAAKPAPEQLIIISESEINTDLQQVAISDYRVAFPDNRPLLPTRGLRRLAACWYLQPGMDFEFATILLGRPDMMYGGYWPDWDWLEDGISICEDDQGVIRYITIDKDTE